VKVVTWNVAKRVSVLAQQAAALASAEPDVVALQEVTARSWPLWRAALATIGLPNVCCSLTSADPAREPAARRRGGVLLAARAPLEPAEPIPVPRPESALAGTVDGITVHTVHIPNAANGWTKIDTLVALREGLARGSGPRIVCGDLNPPRRESPEGAVMSFARDSYGRLRDERGERWDEGELGVVPGLRDVGFADAFRALHGYAEKSPSWVYPSRHHPPGGYRIDHVFVSAELRALAAAYRHDWRDAGLSDHAALEVVAEPAS
jgi:exonuclease III